MKAPRGQNFLRRPWQRRVADAVQARPSDVLLEIGGGTGDVSELLAGQAGRLIVVEVDRELARRLEQRFAGRPDVAVLHADILRVDLTRLAADASANEAAAGHSATARPPASGSDLALPRRLRVFGNLPYYISSPILLHLFAAASIIRDATLMLQREVAQRLLAQPGGSDFGLLSATAQFYTRGWRLFDLPPSAFDPAPKVTSRLIRLNFEPRGAQLGIADAHAFMAFLRTAFAQKRKRLANNLKARYTPAQISAALAAQRLDANVRAEQLGVDALAALYRALSSPD